MQPATQAPQITKWWQRPWVAFVLVWLVLPNLPFVLFWVLGGPPRMDAIALYFGLGILATKLPLFIVFPLYAVLVGADILKALALIFSMTTTALLRSLDDLMLMGVGPYLGAIVLVLAGMGLFYYLAWRLAPYWKATSLLPVLGALLPLIVLDSYAQSALGHSFGRFISVAAPFDSAVLRSGVEPLAQGAQSPSLLLVVVESWGSLRDKSLRANIRQPLQTVALQERYEYSEGETAFYGTTTHAELRELCGRWMDYGDLTAEVDAGCLPAQFGAAGFTSVALHGFSSAYFDRRAWYPKLGFQQSLFLQELQSKGRQKCHKMFPGLCDSEVAQDVGRLLRSDSTTPSCLLADAR